MSASQEKKRRSQAVQEGPTKKDIEAQQALKAKKQFRLKAIIAGVIVVAILLFVVVFNTNFIYRTVTAAKINGESYSVADMNYWYGVGILNFTEKYGDYLSYMLDPNTSLKKQVYDETTGKTWHEFFVDSAEQSLENITALLLAAEEAGHQFTEEDYANAANTLATIDYASSGYKSLSKYLEGVYGKGVNKEVYLRNTEKLYLASAYADVVLAGFDFQEEDYRAYYEENSINYDLFVYNMYFVEAEKDEEGNVSEDALAAAIAAANDIAAASSIDDFGTRIQKYCDEDEKEKYSNPINPSYRYSYLEDGLSATFSEWLVDEARVEGDTHTIEMKSGCYVLYFVEKGGNEYNTRDFRAIRINTNTEAEDVETLKTNWENARTSAEGILQSFNRIVAESPDMETTEQEFINFVSSYSADTSVQEGLYAQQGRGVYTVEMEDWLFAADRAKGDTAVFEDDTGFYIVFYVGENDPQWKVLCATALQDKTYSDWLTERTDKITIVSTADKFPASWLIG